MSFDQDPNEQANISGADLAILIDELKMALAENEELKLELEATRPLVEQMRKVVGEMRGQSH